MIQIDVHHVQLVMVYQTIVHVLYVKPITINIQTVLNHVKIVITVNITTITPVQIVQKDIIAQITLKPHVQTVLILKTQNPKQKTIVPPAPKVTPVQTVTSPCVTQASIQTQEQKKENATPAPQATDAILIKQIITTIITTK